MRHAPERLERALLYATAVIVAGSVLAIGGAPVPVVLVFGAAAVLVGLMSTFLGRPRAGVGPVLVLLGLGVYSALQAIPLPIRWLEVLSPAAADVWSRCLLPLGESVTTGSLSLDPGASLVESLKWCSYAGLWYAASALSGRGGCERLLGLVFGSCVLVAIASLGHLLIGAERVWGMYEPLNPIPPSHVGPLLNPNSLAGYTNLGVLVGLGLLFRDPPVLPRAMLGGGLVILLTASLRTASRGGIAALLVGILAFGIATTVASRRREGRLSAAKAIVSATGALVALAVMIVLSSADAYFWTELKSENEVKLQLPGWVMPMASDHPWFGVGRGAFATVFQAYRPLGGGNIVFTHAENFVIHWIAEWGLLVAVAAMAAFGWMLRPTNMGFGRSTLTTGAWTGVAILLLQNLVDLGTELYGVGVAIAVTLGAVWGDVLRRGRGRVLKTARDVRPRVRAALACGAPALALAAVFGAHPVEQDRSELAERVAAAHGLEARRQLYDEVRARTLRHPGDHYFPLMGAIIARSLGDPPIPWLQRALERGPKVGRVHFLLGQVLGDYGHVDQALLELRLAAEYEEGLAFYTSQAALKLTRDPERLLSAAPEGRGGDAVLEALANALSRPEDLDARERIDLEAVARNPKVVTARDRLVDRRLAALETKSPPCEDAAACAREIAEHAASFETHAPATSRATVTRARLALAEGRAADAADMLRGACDGKEDRARCLKLHADIVARLEDHDAELDEVLTNYLAASCAEPKVCAEAHAFIASLRTRKNQPRHALESLRRAAREDPTAARWLLVADHAERLGAAAVALEALEKVRVASGPDPELDARIARARSATNRLER